MNLTKMYEIQEELKERIGYKGEDKFEKLILAFLVEVGECANDWRGFKYWSKDQTSKQTLLEEYVDGFHFVLEIGIELKEDQYFSELPKDYSFSSSGVDITQHFKEIMFQALCLEVKKHIPDGGETKKKYKELLSYYMTLGVMLGFTTAQIERAYLEKNAINHERQKNGY